MNIQFTKSELILIIAILEFMEEKDFLAMDQMDRTKKIIRKLKSVMNKSLLNREEKI